MNVENSREADPVRAEALAGPLRAACIDVALILSCIRARRAKRRMHRSRRGKVIVDWLSQLTFLSPATRSPGFLNRTPRRSKEGLKWLQLIPFQKIEAPSFSCGPAKIRLCTALCWSNWN